MRQHNKLGTLVVGDLHGDYYTAETILEAPHNIVFVGDYLDSFVFSKADQERTIRSVMAAAKETPEKVTILQGNHEHSYMEGYGRCSGWNPVTQDLMFEIHKEFAEVSHLYTWVDDFLVTHAGLTSQNLPRLAKYANLEEITSLAELVDAMKLEGAADHLASFIGRARGGWHKAGGITWCDWWSEFEPIPFVKQIVGHSAARPVHYTDNKGVVTKGENYNVDCLQSSEELLLVKDNEATILTIDEVFSPGTLL